MVTLVLPHLFYFVAHVKNQAYKECGVNTWKPQGVRGYQPSQHPELRLLHGRPRAQRGEDIPETPSHQFRAPTTLAETFTATFLAYLAYPHFHCQETIFLWRDHPTLNPHDHGGIQDWSLHPLPFYLGWPIKVPHYPATMVDSVWAHDPMRSIQTPLRLSLPFGLWI